MEFELDDDRSSSVREALINLSSPNLSVSFDLKRYRTLVPDTLYLELEHNPPRFYSPKYKVGQLSQPLNNALREFLVLSGNPQPENIFEYIKAWGFLGLSPNDSEFLNRYDEKIHDHWESIEIWSAYLRVFRSIVNLVADLSAGQMGSQQDVESMHPALRNWIFPNLTHKKRYSYPSFFKSDDFSQRRAPFPSLSEIPEEAVNSWFEEYSDRLVTADDLEIIGRLLRDGLSDEDYFNFKLFWFSYYFEKQKLLVTQTVEKLAGPSYANIHPTLDWMRMSSITVGFLNNNPGKPTRRVFHLFKILVLQLIAALTTTGVFKCGECQEPVIPHNGRTPRRDRQNYCSLICSTQAKNRSTLKSWHKNKQNYKKQK